MGNSVEEKGKSCILTDSPVKDKIEDDKQKTAAARKGNNTPAFEQNLSSESDNDELVLSSTTDDVTVDHTTFVLEEIKKGDYLLTKVSRKKT